ncbi:aminotransferase class IV [Helicobacter bilis]|uniref:aminotransferase class IV n=1 Tax=Helicobacter bilis TaxID=37372 RepID=UPI002943A586|nr:aminotransferase class IV [Helicobacter bilis]
MIETILLHKDSVFLLHSHLYRLYSSAKALGFNYTAIESALKHLDINAPHTYKDLNILESLEILAKSSLPNRDMQYHIMRLESFSYYTQYNKTNMLDSTLYNDNANATLCLWDSIHTLQKLLQIGNNDFIANDFSFCRLLLTKEGNLTYSIQALQPINNAKVRLATLDTITPLSYHKTTKREHFKDATTSIAKNECFDYIYMDKDSKILEGSRSNIIIAKNGKYYTPPQSLGILAGTLRNTLIKCGICTEKILYKKDLYEASEMYCVNSIRGIIPVNLA